VSSVSPIVSTDSLGPPQSRVPRSIPELLLMLSDQFHCMIGPPRSYFEIPIGVPLQDPFFIRGIYTSIRLGSWARREDCERHLIGHAWTQLRCARDEIITLHGEDALPLLFWRTLPHIVEEPPTAPDLEEIGGYSTPHREFYRTNLFMRLWVPGAPEFAKLDSSRSQETTYV
jgi:hypothetical protein